MTFTSPPRSTGFRFLGSPSWIVSGSACLLGSECSPWVALGAFCVLRSSSFSLGSLRLFGIFLCQGLECLLCDWGGQLGSCVFFLVLQAPSRSVLGPGWPLFARVFPFLLPSRRPPYSVRGHGLGNRAAKLRHGTVGFSCSFFFVVLPTPFSAPSRGVARVI